MKIRFRHASILVLAMVNQLVAQPNQYKFKREIVEIDSMWHSLVLPNAIFEKISSDFSDIRIYGISPSNNTIEAPYILKIGEESNVEKEVDFKLINQSKNEKGTYFTFVLGDQNTINQIKLVFKAKNFDWKVDLDGSQNQKEWFTILDDYRILSIKNSATDYQFTKLDFPDSKYQYFRILIKNEKNPQFESAKLNRIEIKKGTFNNFAIASTKIEQDKKSKQTHIFLDLQMPVSVSRLCLFIGSDFDFYREVSIQYVDDSVKTDKGWYYNYNTLTSGTLNSIEKNEFNFSPTILRKLKLTINNQDNSPLKIDSFSVKGFTYHLEARFNEPANYALYYGNPKALKPDYDINHFKENIPITITSVDLGEELLNAKEDQPESIPLFQNKLWLLMIMAIIIALLGWFSLKMIGSK